MSDPILGDIQCERALLSSAWLAGDFVTFMRLAEADFIDPFCQWLLRHLRALVDAGEPLDMIALQRRVKKPGGTEGLTKLEVDSLPGSLAEVLLTAPTTAHIEYYIGVLRTERMRRWAVRACEKLIERLKAGGDPAELLEAFREQAAMVLTKVPAVKGNDSSQSMKESA